MVADIGQPTSSTGSRSSEKAEQDHLELTFPTTCCGLSPARASNVREPRMYLKLLLFASLKHKEVSIELAREALSDKIRRARTTRVSQGAFPRSTSSGGRRQTVGGHA